jgi:hypothetical protein
LRSLSATLALAFAATTLAAFALVGAYVYMGLERQVNTQDDLDIVLAARHTRRLAGELESLDAVRAHAERLTSQVLGNEALSMAVFDANGDVLVRHNVRLSAPDAALYDAPGAPTDAQLLAPRRAGARQRTDHGRAAADMDGRRRHADARRRDRRGARRSHADPHRDRAQHARPRAAARRLPRPAEDCGSGRRAVRAAVRLLADPHGACAAARDRREHRPDHGRQARHAARRVARRTSCARWSTRRTRCSRACSRRSRTCRSSARISRTTCVRR